MAINMNAELLYITFKALTLINPEQPSVVLQALRPGLLEYIPGSVHFEPQGRVGTRQDKSGGAHLDGIVQPVPAWKNGR